MTDENPFDITDEAKFRLWVVKEISTIKSDVSWIKNVLSPSLWLALLGILGTVILAILRSVGR